jgi:hypothetical protein
MTVRSEIETRLNDWAKAQVPPIPVAFQNVKFTKPLSGSYLELYFLGDNSMNRDLAASGVRTYGMFQVNCFAPVNTGMAQVEALAQSVKDLFPVLPKTGTVSIESPPNASGSYEADTFVCVPVRVSYRVET